MLNFVLIIVVFFGLAGVSYPLIKRSSQKRLSSQVDFLIQRLEQTSNQLEHTTASKFPTDYQRLQQQVNTDTKDLARLIETKGSALPAETLAVAWDLVNRSALLLPSPPPLNRPLALETSQGNALTSQSHIKRLAPEIVEVVQNIQADDQLIRQKIETGDIPNRQELLAVHEANMGRYQDILEGYLKIKESPKAYHQAEERLTASRKALAEFDAKLDDTLKQINEGDMMTFEVSLRMIQEDY